MSSPFWRSREGAARWDQAADEGPARAEQLALLVALLEPARPARVLELGIGSGRVAELVLDTLPDARLAGVDGSAAMLDLARDRLARFGERVELIECGFEELDRVAIDLGFDAAVSVQALHHLDDGAKADAFGWLGQAVRPGGLFLMRDKVAVHERVLAEHDATWAWYGQPVGSESIRDPADTPSTLTAQLQWLRDAGFEPAVLHAVGHYVLVAARR
jgi:SAM-dependent methyltransferase